LDDRGLKPRRRAKWAVHPPDVLPAWVAEMDLPLAAPVKAALHEAIERDDVGYLGPDLLGDDPAAAFLERGRVALSRGLDFGAEGAGFARLNLGTTPELVDEAVARMAASV
jgi:cystathionine beta-lyase